MKPEPFGHLEQAVRWKLRLPDELSAAEEEQLQAWLAADPARRQSFDDLEQTLTTIDRFAGAPEMVGLRGAALAAARRSHDVLRARTFFASRLGRVAGIAFIAIVAGAIGTWLYFDSHTFRTGIGERRTVSLADGSGVSLDAATKIDINFSGDRRRLLLERGRARFDVAKDPLRPFTVEAGSKVIVALGTSFSVELIDSQVRVVLYEGKVQVLEAADPKVDLTSGAAALLPGHELIAARAGKQNAVQIAPIDPARSQAWEGGDLAFADEPLALAVERINRYSKDRVEIADAAAAAVRISGVFHAGDTEAFVDGVTRLFPVRGERDGENVVLSFDGGKKGD